MKNHFSAFMGGICIGAFYFLLFDPVKGHSQRVLIRDKGTRFYKRSRVKGRKHLKDMRNRFHGLQAKFTHLFKTNNAVPDGVLEARVRSSFGRVVSHPRSVYVRCVNGVVTLSGPILKHEVDEIIRHVKKVPGVKEVVNWLTAYKNSEGISALQGSGPEYLHT